MESVKINFKSSAGQQFALAEVRNGSLGFVDAFRLCFPEEVVALENMEIDAQWDRPDGFAVVCSHEIGDV
jgi:hypothetical protein